VLHTNQRKGEKRKGWRREGRKVTQRMGGTGQDMGWDREGRERRKGRRVATAPNFNFWRRH